MPDPHEKLVVQVALGERSYPIVIASGQIAGFAAILASWWQQRGSTGAGPEPVPNKALIVTDENVEQPYAHSVKNRLVHSGIAADVVVLEPGEKSKSLASVETIYDRLVAIRANRQTLIVAVGGGVVGDVAGFAAATYARGLPFVQVPTSLLAMVDSSVGGKVGVNHPQGKNLIGAFHQPRGVLIDTDTLESLPNREMNCGLAEVIKYGVILDGAFFEYLEQNVSGLNDRRPDVLMQIIARSCRLKADVVERDEFERTGLRAVLNFGHTFGHAFEALCQYSELLHGEAVAIGMVYAARLAERRRLIDASITGRLVNLLAAVGLPVRLPESLSWDPDAVLNKMWLDKKVSQAKLRFVLPTRLGHVELFDDVPESDLRAVLANPPA